MKSLFFIVIFFSGMQSFSMNSTESRQDLVDLLSSEHIDLISLHSSLNGLWSAGAYGSDDASMKAYIAFLDMANGCFPDICTDVGSRLVKHELALRLETEDVLIDQRKIDLWNRFGSLSDGMKPVIRGVT